MDGEYAVEEGLEEVLGLAQRLALHRSQALVPRHQRSELLLQRKGWNRNLELFQLLQIDSWLRRAPRPSVGLCFSNWEFHH